MDIEVNKESHLPAKISDQRLRYLGVVNEVRQAHGGLEDIRKSLGYTRKEIAELLLVDPSAWSRWAKNESKVPPHVYRALDWYLKLETINKNKTEKARVSPAQIEDLRKEISDQLIKMRDSMQAMEKEAFQEMLDNERKELLSTFEKEAHLGSAWKLLMLLNLVGLVFLAIAMI